MNSFQWFKFSPSDWMMGKIMRCDDVTQARFLRVCCLYWNKHGALKAEDAEIELMESWDQLVMRKIIEVDGEFVTIAFLDEQLEEVDSISKKRSASAKRRWKKQSKSNASANQDYASASKNDASAMQVHKSAMQDYAEERRGEEKREEESVNAHGEFDLSDKVAKKIDNAPSPYEKMKNSLAYNPKIKKLVIEVAKPSLQDALLKSISSTIVKQANYSRFYKFEKRIYEEFEKYLRDPLKFKEYKKASMVVDVN